LIGTRSARKDDHRQHIDDKQRSVNILLGSVLASIGLTIPAVLAIGFATGHEIVLGLGATDMTLLLPQRSLFSTLTFAAPRTNVLFGAVHLLVFLRVPAVSSSSGDGAMSDGVAVPAWLLVLMAALAVWALYEHVVAPALRFLVTHPAESVIDELGERLRIGIRPFQRTKRQALVHSLLADRRVQAAAEKYARENKITLPAALRRVERYAREIVPAFNAYLYFRIGYWIGRWIARSLYRVRIGYLDPRHREGRVRRDRGVRVNHRSNMDYVLTAYLAADQAALSYAVGEWARLWPLSALIRAMGAYFVRRDSKDELYRRVLERYIADGDRGRCPAGGLPGRGPHARRAHPRAEARRNRLHDARLPDRGPSATSCSCRSGSTTTACSRTGACCSRPAPRRGAPAG